MMIYSVALTQIQPSGLAYFSTVCPHSVPKDIHPDTLHHAYVRLHLIMIPTKQNHLPVSHSLRRLMGLYVSQAITAFGFSDFIFLPSYHMSCQPSPELVRSTDRTKQFVYLTNPDAAAQ